MDQQAERVIGLGRGTGEEIVKWNQMTALRFQTWGKHRTFPASLPRFQARKTKKTNDTGECEQLLGVLVYKASVVLQLFHQH